MLLIGGRVLTENFDQSSSRMSASLTSILPPISQNEAHEDSRIGRLDDQRRPVDIRSKGTPIRHRPASQTDLEAIWRHRNSGGSGHNVPSHSITGPMMAPVKDLHAILSSQPPEGEAWHNLIILPSSYTKILENFRLDLPTCVITESMIALVQGIHAMVTPQTLEEAVALYRC